MSEATIAEKRPVLIERPGAYAMLLQFAFNQICDKQDWKGPIDCLVPWEAASTYVEAIKWMTATSPECKHVIHSGQSYARLTSVGYRMGPAGDH